MTAPNHRLVFLAQQLLQSNWLPDCMIYDWTWWTLMDSVIGAYVYENGCLMLATFFFMMSSESKMISELTNRGHVTFLNMGLRECWDLFKFKVFILFDFELILYVLRYCFLLRYSNSKLLCTPQTFHDVYSSAAGQPLVLLGSLLKATNLCKSFFSAFKSFS